MRLRQLARGVEQPVPEERSARERAALRGARPPPSLKGFTCIVCAAIGEHFSDDCPDRFRVGLPEVLQKEHEAKSECASEAKKYEEPSGVFVMESAVLSGFYDVYPPDYLPHFELEEMIRRRPDVPPYLRCRSCMILADNALWCSRCNVILCSPCVFPPEGSPYCPSCSATDVDAFHEVGAVRAMIAAWKRTKMESIDVYSRSGDDEPKPRDCHTRRRPRDESRHSRNQRDARKRRKVK